MNSVKFCPPDGRIVMVHLPRVLRTCPSPPAWARRLTRAGGAVEVVVVRVLQSREGSEMMSKQSIVGLAVVCLVGGISQTGQAVVLTGTPEDSWAYAVLSPAGQSITTTYFPVSRSDFAAAVFQGYATYEPGTHW